MSPDLQPAVMALAELDEGEFAALIEATNNVPQTAPGLLAWIESACDWELNRRQGLDYPLQPPDAAIPPEEDGVSIDAATHLRAQFARDETSKAPAMVAVLDAVFGLLPGSRKTHWLRAVATVHSSAPAQRPVVTWFRTTIRAPEQRARLQPQA